MNDNTKIKIGLIQMAMRRQKQENLEIAIDKVRAAADRGAQVVCLPELFCSPYFCQTENPDFFDLAESIPGPATEAMRRVAKEKRIVIIASLFERRAPGLYHNTAAVLDQSGQIAGIYRKMHIPDDPAYYEKYYFTPGDLGFPAIPTDFGKLGVLICWDQWYPEAARLMALQGASILFYPTAIGWHPHEKEAYGESQKSAWITIQRAHAIANGVFVAAVNRVGYETRNDGETGIEFLGHSFLSDPFGNLIAQAGIAEDNLVAEIDLRQIEEVRRNWPFLRDRRIDFYSDLNRRYIDC
ncbi:MAG: acyltransferase [Candidatus Omnitrophota bacterium]|jgi:N-carbamoylputrescine amidase|nr:MAG: acyltransferase [Candidatus Omnitrophota bacterium]